ncbi:MAG TPA: hypothetical protein VGB77_01495, partial [Abditibacteriaceae bacterium]
FNSDAGEVVGYYAIEDADIPGSLVADRDELVLRVAISAEESDEANQTELKYIKMGNDPQEASNTLNAKYPIGWESSFFHP